MGMDWSLREGKWEIRILAHLKPMFLSYGNQSIDLPCKSVDWSLYDGKISLHPFVPSVPFL